MMNRYEWENVDGVTPDAYKGKPILCIDFDGTLMTYHRWEGASVCKGDPIEGAMKWITELIRDEFFDLHVHSSRSHQQGGIDAMRDWLIRRYMNFHRSMLWNADRVIRNSVYFPKVKPPAVVALDDRVITFTGKYPTLDELKFFKPWTP